MREPKVTIILGKKLLAIRLWQKIAQGKMRLRVIPGESEGSRARVSQWEKGIRQPPHEALIRLFNYRQYGDESLIVRQAQVTA